jgi:hypothetical protein
MYDFGNDKVSGRLWVPPLIPMCRLVPMELVQLSQKHGKGVEKLEESFLNEGFARRTGARFYVQPRDRNGERLVITKEEKEGWDDLWKEQDWNFITGCKKEPEFKWMIESKFAVADGNHQLWA